MQSTNSIITTKEVEDYLGGSLHQNYMMPWNPTPLRQPHSVSRKWPTYEPQGTSGAISYSIEFRNETRADVALPFPKIDLTQPAREKLQSLADSAIAQLAEAILNKFRARLLKLDNLSALPSISVFEHDSGALLIEWIFVNMRIGINLERDTEESSWFLVTDQSAGGVNAFGLLSNANLDWLVSWLVCFVENTIELAK